ncbi:MAG: hypothetical protein AB7L76_12615 [Burkholderiaceae bacterium]
MSTTKPIGEPLAFGWYFVDLLHDDGSRFTVAVHGANGFALPRRASVVVWHYRDGAKPKMWVAPGGGPQLPAHSMLCGMRNDIADISPTGTGWQLHVDSPRFSLDLRIEQQVALWRPAGLPYPLRLEADSGSFDWVVACPLGRAEGRFSAGDLQFALSGDAYVDVNFGSLDLAAELDWWKWSTIELARNDRVVVSTTKWRRAPAVSGAIRVTPAGVQELGPEQLGRSIGVDLGPLALDTPTPPALPLASELDLSVLGGRLGLYRRWSGRLGGTPAVLALLQA